MEFEEGKEQIVYCKAACGNNIHMHCFEKWAATKNGSGAVTCPFCRAPWTGDEDMIKKIAKGGTVNSEGYVNVASQLGITGERGMTFPLNIFACVTHKKNYLGTFRSHRFRTYNKRIMFRMTKEIGYNSGLNGYANDTFSRLLEL